MKLLLRTLLMGHFGGDGYTMVILLCCHHKLCGHSEMGIWKIERSVKDQSNPGQCSSFKIASNPFSDRDYWKKRGAAWQKVIYLKNFSWCYFVGANNPFGLKTGNEGRQIFINIQDFLRFSKCSFLHNSHPPHNLFQLFALKINFRI